MDFDLAQVAFTARGVSNTKASTEHRFFVYALSLSPDMTQVFYGGKGQGHRIGSHCSEAERGHLCPKCAVVRHCLKRRGRYWSSVVFASDDENEVLWHEMKFLTSYPYGTLCNQIGGRKIPVALTSTPQKHGIHWWATITYCNPGSAEIQTEDIVTRYEDVTRAKIREVYDQKVVAYYAALCNYRGLK